MYPENFILSPSPSLTIAYINIRGQTGLNHAKQSQLECFIRIYKPDILHLQEINVTSETFETCDLINSNYNVLSNNALNKYGTASLVSSELEISNIKMDTEGRVIVFDVNDITFGNVYFPCGNDKVMKRKRENYAAEILPQLLINAKDVGAVGGDWNCILDEKDATKNPNQKLSQCLNRLVKTFKWVDSYRELFPEAVTYSRYYENDLHGEGATRIDRQYNWGPLVTIDASYVGVSFSDHLGYIAKVRLPALLSKLSSPKSKPQFKAKPEVIRDSIFLESLRKQMTEWNIVKESGVDILQWWELIVKPGLRKLLINRGKELKREKVGVLNLLLLRQSHLVRKIQAGSLERLQELKQVQLEIMQWHAEECEKVKIQSRSEEINSPESVRIYHHELHAQHIKKSAILKLKTEKELLVGHAACAKYLEDAAADILAKPANLDPRAQDILLREVKPVFTEADNSMMKKVPDKKEVKESVFSANSEAAPGTDGLSMLVYKHCWEILGDDITSVCQAIYSGASPTLSQRTSLMVHGSKSNKPPNSPDPKHKRRISLLNSDFKILTGILNNRFKKVTTHTLNANQLSAGNNRRIHHGINRARDAIQSATSRGEGVGILDNDYQSAFDYMVLTWILKVLKAKGLHKEVINLILNLYSNNLTIVVVNGVQGRCLANMRWSIRQGDRPSSNLFNYGLDPHLDWLEHRLRGITIYKTNFFSPTTSVETYKLMAYVDDVKPSITSMNEFSLVDQGSALFESASGCRLHRDPRSGKVKFLPLGRWKGTLTKEDLPVNYIVMSDHLDMVGVQLKASFIQTRKDNCDKLQEKVQNVIRPWKGGKFMHLSLRSFSINSHCLSKVWFKCPSINLRACDHTKISTALKGWLFQDQLEKPEDFVLYRSRNTGGLGLLHTECKSLSFFIRSFMETAANPAFLRNHYHEALFKWHVLGDRSIINPGTTPYYNTEFFNMILSVRNEGLLNVTTMSSQSWYRVLLENKVTHRVTMDGSRELKPCRAELSFPDRNWDMIWMLIVTPGLPSELTSFLWLLFHNILPTKERLFRMKISPSPQCDLCDMNTVDCLQHALLECSYNDSTGIYLLKCLQTIAPNLEASEVFSFNFPMERHLNLPVMYIFSSLLHQVWTCRLSNKTCSQTNIRATMEAGIQIIRKSRLFSAADRIEEILRKV